MNDSTDPGETRPYLVNWRNRQYAAALTQYAENGNTCLALLNSDGNLEVKCSVNLHELAPHFVYIKDYSENRGILEALLKAALIRKTGHKRRNGSAEFELCELAPAFAEEYGIVVPDAEPTPKAATHQDTPLDPKPSHGVPPSARPEPSDDDVGEAAADWAGFNAQQNEAAVERAREEARNRPDADADADSDPDAPTAA